MSQLRRISGSAAAADRWCGPWRQGWRHSEVLVLLAATDTAAVPGISAAGATPSSRLRTAAADAELLLLGPAGERPHALPPLPAGVSPALISHVVLRELALAPLVVDLGCPVAPAVAHLRLPGLAGGGPARCLSGGEALDPGRLEALLALGRRWGEHLSPGRPLLLAECVPGGTSTALAVLVGLGVAAHGLVSGSLRHPDHGRKAALVERGLRAAGLSGTAAGDGAAALRVAAALGDPMQALSAAMVLAAAAAGRPVLLAECVPGGTSTALAVLVGLGVAAHGLVSGSLRHPDHGRKAALVERGLRAAGLEGTAAGDGAAAGRVAAALGDPMQALAAAMVLAAAAAGRPVLLAGGSQMAAVLALALALAPPCLRPAIAAGTALGTTAWVADEAGSDLALLLRRIGERWGVEPLAFAADLRFTDPCHPALAAYERGNVKEGVGAGGLALLWQLSGRPGPALARLCDQACATLLGPPPPTVR